MVNNKDQLMLWIIYVGIIIVFLIYELLVADNIIKRVIFFILYNMVLPFLLLFIYLYSKQ